MLSDNKKTTELISYTAIFAVIAIMFSYFEAFIPINYFIPIPGVKLGIANIAIVFVMFYIGEKESFIVLFLRIIISNIIFGNISALIFSACGGILSLSSSLFIKRTFAYKFSFIGICIIGAAFHNTGQIIAALLILKNLFVLYYLPFLLISSIICGLLTGIVLNIIFKVICKKNIH